MTNLQRKLTEEVTALSLAMLYFAAWIAALLVLKQLILAEYQIAFHGLSLALIGALILSKVVLILEHVSLGAWVRARPAWVDIILRTILYSLGVALVLVLEKGFEARHEYGGFSAAVTAIFQKAASTPPGSKSPKPVGNINIDFHTFQDLLIERKLLPERAVDPFEDPTPIVSQLRCQTTDGVLVDRDTVLRTLLEGYVRFVILGDDGVPIRWGRKRRLFTGAAKEAVLTLSPRCTHPGCRVRAGRCQIDHLTEWHEQGETCPENGGVGCGRHNRLKHRQRLRVERDRMGNWHTYRPDGSELR